MSFRVLSLYWLLLAIPAAAILEWVGARPVWIFLASGLAVVPLAGLVGRATENLGETLGPAVGGLLNASFGNAAELIIGIMALRKGPAMYPLVKASLTGSIIGNVLFVLGLAFLAGGLRYTRQTFNRTMASMGATLLALASIGLVVPTLFHALYRFDHPLTEAERHTVASLSQEIAIVLAVIYCLSVVFSLQTHRHVFAGPDHQLPVTGEHRQPEWGRQRSLIVLVLATIGVAAMSELLVGSVGEAAHALGWNEVFVGVVVVAVVGNAAEHSTAVLMALKDKMDLAFTIAVGSSIQIALFVAPVLVGVSMLMGDGRPLDLHFSSLEVVAVLASLGVLSLVSQDGESHWMEGAMLLAVYFIFALAFYHFPTRS